MSVAETQDGTEKIEELMQEMGAAARRAAAVLASAPEDQKNLALRGAAEAMRKSVGPIMDANALDGEFSGAFPSEGDTVGGDFVVTFEIEVPPPSAFLAD